MSALGIVLVHGYMGSPENLAPLAVALTDQGHHVESVCLPGHGEAKTPAFTETAFLTEIAAAIDRQQAVGRKLVLLGHSTGGNLLLAEISRRLAVDPRRLDTLLLLILCSTPPRIDLSYAERWSQHTQGRESRFDDLAALVSLINRPLRQPTLPLPSPVLVIHGEADELVPVDDAELWRQNRLHAPQRQARIAGGRHHLFAGTGDKQAIDIIGLAMADATRRCTETSAAPQATLPEMQCFCATWPDSTPHLLNSPAGKRWQGQDFSATPVADCQPTIANIEITTRCTLGCAACARTHKKLQSRHMGRDDFRRILAHLPHAGRVVLVGLGEPLLHPEVVDFIRIAAAGQRHVGLVTNAMALNADMAEQLCASGLASLTFSLDAISQATADQVRQGSDMVQIRAHILGFMAEKHRQDSPIATAVFTALGSENVGEFAAIVDFVAEAGIDALMVTDLNFAANQQRSLHQQLTPKHAEPLRQALRHAAARRLPVLSVWGLEEWALDERPLDYLLLRGEQIARRSNRHRQCLSPWQSIPVNVDGHLTLCDCQPDAVIGNIHSDALSDWWNGPAMTAHRQRMLSDNPPEACLVCPRF